MKKQEVVLRDFTMIEQSKVLSKFLPTETANMVYCYTKEGDKLISPIPTHLTSTPTNTFKYLYCWSLGALLNIIPYPTLGKHADETWSCASWVETVDPYFVKSCDSPIDAVFEMILKLHKQKLL